MHFLTLIMQQARNILDFNRKMENKKRVNDNYQDSSFNQAQLYSQYSNSSKIYNRDRKSKKDNLKQKKKNKNKDKQEPLDNKLQQNQQKINTSSQAICLISKYFRPKKLKIALDISAQIAPYPLAKIIYTRPYISVSNSNRITGNFGHGTAIFKRPIIQGQFFMEFIVRQDAPKDKPTKNKSSVRFGLCDSSFDPAFPLGVGQSIAYKEGGAIITGGQNIELVQSFGVGDVIGIFANISPPHKHLDKKSENEGSSVAFYKNGSVIYIHKKLKQIFYCFAVSLYNYSQVDVAVGPESIYPMPKKIKHYYSMLNQKILYKDLSQKKMFKL